MPQRCACGLRLEYRTTDEDETVLRCPRLDEESDGVAQWKWVTTTQYVLGSGLRQIAARVPYMNEPGGTKYCVSGAGHKASVHATLEEAMEAAQASL